MADEFIGNKYFRPSGLFNESVTLQKNITHLILKDELDYEFRMIAAYEKEI
jgi:hypothetical protein